MTALFFRLFSTMMLSITVGRWIYDEVKLIMPGAIPAIDYVLESTSLPTHNKWPKDSMDQLAVAVSDIVRPLDALAEVQAPRQMRGSSAANRRPAYDISLQMTTSQPTYPNNRPHWAQEMADIARRVGL